MNGKNEQSRFRIIIMRLIRLFYRLLYTTTILCVGIFCGALATAFIANGEPRIIRDIMNKFTITRSGVRCLPRHYAKYITLPEKLVIKDSNLLHTIQKEAPSMDVFPLDIIIDINQLDYNYAFNQGAFEVSSTPDVYQSSVDMSLEESAFRNSKITFYHLVKMSRRYDLSYDAFLPFHKFYLSAPNRAIVATDAREVNVTSAALLKRLRAQRFKTLRAQIIGSDIFLRRLTLDELFVIVALNDVTASTNVVS